MAVWSDLLPLVETLADLWEVIPPVFGALLRLGMSLIHTVEIASA